MNPPFIHPSALIEGNVSIASDAYVGAGAILTAHGGSIVIGSRTVIMENAIVRATKKFDCVIGDHVLIGPKACITGARIEGACFIATNATVFHGVVMGRGSVVAVNGIVHVATVCPENTFVPINHVAFGTPAKLYSPLEITDFHADLRGVGFARYVYGIDPTGLDPATVCERLTEQITHNLPH